MPVLLCPFGNLVDLTWPHILFLRIPAVSPAAFGAFWVRYEFVALHEVTLTYYSFAYLLMEIVLAGFL